MKTDIQYEILMDYKDFEGEIPKGTRMFESEWIARLGFTQSIQLSLFARTFKLVEVLLYTEEDMVLFAKYIIERNFPKDDTGVDLYLKWKSLK